MIAKEVRFNTKDLDINRNTPVSQFNVPVHESSLTVT